MATSIDELEEQIQDELGTIRHNQLEEITRSHEREAAARRWRRETDKTLTALRKDVTALQEGQAALQKGQAVTHQALALLLEAQGLEMPTGEE